MEIVNTFDISDRYVNLLQGRYLHIKHRSDGYITVQFGLPNRRKPSGFLRNFPATADAQAIRRILNSDLVKIHEIAGVSLNALVTAIMISRPIKRGPLPSHTRAIL